jgi:hypothetical protein
MLNSAAAEAGDFFAQRRWLVLAFGGILAAVAAMYAIAHLSIATGTDSL